MNLSDNLIAGPVLSLLAAAGAAAAAVTGVASTFGLTPFQSDIAASLVFFALAAYWIWLGNRVYRPLRNAGFVKDGAKASVAITARLPYFGVALVFASASCWFSIPIARLLTTPDWKICGTLTGRCAATYCATGLDFRLRQTSNECVPPLDASGYFEMTSLGTLSYRPDLLRLQCNGTELAPVRVPKTFSDPRCGARMEIP
jgi:hypothetical protein